MDTQLEPTPGITPEPGRLRGLSREHLVAAGEALFVTILWSSSWVIIKFGLNELTPLVFSGLRYALASSILMTVVLSKNDLRKSMKSLQTRQIGKLVTYGIVFITITQGTQFVGLSLLDTITVSMLLNMTPVIVLVLGVLLLGEKPTLRQMGWVMVGLLGVFIYFYPVDLLGAEILGLTVVTLGVMTNAVSSIMGRAINRDRLAHPIVVTTVSMTAGGIILLLVGLYAEGVPLLSPTSIMYVLWLSVVNTALAFTIWNRAMRTLRAVDMTMINSTMLPQIAILSLVFLGIAPDYTDWLGLILVAMSVLFVQVSQSRIAGQRAPSSTT